MLSITAWQPETLSMTHAKRSWPKKIGLDKYGLVGHEMSWGGYRDSTDSHWRRHDCRILAPRADPCWISIVSVDWFRKRPSPLLIRALNHPTKASGPAHQSSCPLGVPCNPLPATFSCSRGMLCVGPISTQAQQKKAVRRRTSTALIPQAPRSRTPVLRV